MSIEASPGPSEAEIRAAVAAITAVGPAQQNLLLGFDRLAGSWSERSAHQAFVYEATRAGELRLAGQLYRMVLERRPEDPEALAAQKQIGTSAMFAGGAIGRGPGAAPVRFPRWVFLSGGISIVWLLFDLASNGTFSWLDLGMVLICVGSFAYAVYAVRR